MQQFSPEGIFMKFKGTAMCIILTALTAPAYAEVDGAAVLGGAIGGGAGAAVGSAIGGREGAIIGGAVGGAAGAAVATHKPKVEKKVVVEKEVHHVHHKEVHHVHHKHKHHKHKYHKNKHHHHDDD
jgi:outer membrane lipoprotein SlyB